MTDTAVALTVTPVTRDEFVAEFTFARVIRHEVASATTAPDELPASATYYLSQDRRAGFGVTDNGTGIALFSTFRGRGSALVRAAIDAGVWNLDCFDGYLVDLYMRHGFVTLSREANWAPDGPDVVFMSLVTTVALGA